ncbi:MAG: hypothetical protein KAS29_20835, partial [Bacteroidales bacterium]|nr:hypothetical protein [Bacteroidales bacterium]
MDGDIPYYSRRIGSAPVFSNPYGDWSVSNLPNFAPILGAAKLTGKSQKGLSVGLVDGLTASASVEATDASGTEKKLEVSPLSNYLASRIKKDFKEGNTVVGGVFSMVNRISSDSTSTLLLPSSAISGGLDLLHYWKNKNYYLEVKSIASQLNGSTEAILRKQLSHIHRYQRPDADHIQVDTLRESLGGHGGLVRVGKNGGKWNFHLQGQYRSPGLNLNDMGYLRQSDFISQMAEVSYKMNEPGDWIRNYEIQFNQEARWSFGGENTLNEIGAFFTLVSNKNWIYLATYNYAFSHLDIRELRGGPALRVDGEHLSGVKVLSNSAKDLSGNAGFHYNVYGSSGSHQELWHAIITWLPIRKLKLSGRAVFNRRQYHQQYVNTIFGVEEDQFVVGHIDQRTTYFTFRGELFLTP